MLRGSILSAQSTGAFSCGAAAVMPSLRSANSLHGSFAASAAFSSPISTTTSCLDVSQNQERGLSTEATGEGESEDSGLRNSDGDEEPPDRRKAYEFEPGGRGRGGGGGGGGAPFQRRPADAAAAGTDMLELVATARELFTRNVDSGSGGGGAGGGGGGGGGVGPLPPLPRELREALYGHRWDRVIVDVRRTHTPVRGRGKREEYTAMVATGNMRGVFGLGIGVAESAQLATARAHLDSLSRLAAVPLYRGHTLYTHVDHTFHRLSIRMMPRPAGWGLRCPDLLYELCGLVGLRDVSIRVRGQRGSRFFVAQCFQEALQKQTTPHDGVEATGMYIREVFRGGPGGRLPCGLRRGVDVM
ncbi:hypothetical protein CHLRE_09g407100v5 [Chlamydomonas reinhardtii]|uniref:S5 DRBM domain-containing protein n=1 Tax=Chlamydomonas reinhardtii TaxID=3055 RepID=A0A2K3DFD3_CHLRE|nr:uncharacterized protein CHLRE_09g407100v5 [Chlamydomonas reinhardtii]PNW79232.1 hypothetical protein CHLRE_09g407100v5 [Chlamydomonas reinhardtii]